MASVDSNRRPNDHCSAEPMSFDEIFSETRGFKFALLNINSLAKHIDELKLFMVNKSLDVLAINESKLDMADSIIWLIWKDTVLFTGIETNTVVEFVFTCEIQ